MLSPAWAMVVMARNWAAWLELEATCRRPPSAGGDALLEDVGGGVHDAGVDVAGTPSARKQARAMVGVVEGVGRWSGRWARRGHWCRRRLLAGMDL